MVAMDAIAAAARVGKARYFAPSALAKGFSKLCRLLSSLLPNGVEEADCHSVPRLPPHERTVASLDALLMLSARYPPNPCA